MPGQSSNREILVLGDVNVDLIGLSQTWPCPGEECLTDRLEFHCGGVGANCALALRQWGVTTRLIACLGRDALADAVLAMLARQGVDLRAIQRTASATTGLLYIHVLPGGQRTFFGSRGANRLVRPQPTRSPLLRSARAACVMGYNFLDPSSEKAALQLMRAVHRNDGWVALDVGMEPSQKIPRKIWRLAGTADLLLVSQQEAAALTGSADPQRSFRKLQRGGARAVVMKLDKRGCLISQAGGIQHVPPFAVRAVDSTGAGDAFTAAFLHAKLQSWPVLEAALLANAAGAVAVGRVGAGDRAPSARQTAALLGSQQLHARWEPFRVSLLRRLRRGLDDKV